jgi:hypothetical protein
MCRVAGARAFGARSFFAARLEARGPTHQAVAQYMKPIMPEATRQIETEQIAVNIVHAP